MNVEIITVADEYGDDTLPALFPFFLKATTDGITLQIYDIVYDKLRFLESMTEEEIFSENTTELIVSECDDFLSKRGYSLLYGKHYRYLISNRNEINRSLVLDSSEVILPDHNYECQVELDRDQLEDGFICFGTVRDGKIVSIAAENPHDEDNTMIDIGVETAKEYRCKGYAASNTAALAYYLLDTGITVTYTAEDDNEASIGLAEKVGFKRHAHTFEVFGRKLSGNGEDNDNDDYDNGEQ